MSKIKILYLLSMHVRGFYIKLMMFTCFYYIFKLYYNVLTKKNHF